jgi:hypothetical protein
LEARAQLQRRDVVAVKADVQLTDGDRLALKLTDRIGEAAGQRHAPRVHADECDGRKAAIVLDDLVGDAADGAANVVGGKDDVAFGGRSPCQGKTPTPEREGRFADAM